jgi:hypothetical protein
MSTVVVYTIIYKASPIHAMLEQADLGRLILEYLQYTWGVWELTYTV